MAGKSFNHCHAARTHPVPRLLARTSQCGKTSGHQAELRRFHVCDVSAVAGPFCPVKETLCCQREQSLRIAGVSKRAPTIDPDRAPGILDRAANTHCGHVRKQAGACRWERDMRSNLRRVGARQIWLRHAVWPAHSAPSPRIRARQRSCA